MYNYWCKPENIDESTIIDRCLEAIENGIDAQFVYMSPDIYSAFCKNMERRYPTQMNASSFGMKQMLIHMLTGPVRLQVTSRKYKCFLMVGTKSDLKTFIHNGVPVDFLSDEVGLEIDRAFQQAIMDMDDE